MVFVLFIDELKKGVSTATSSLYNAYIYNGMASNRLALLSFLKCA